MFYTDNSGNPTGEFGTTNLDYHISYLSIPIYYGLKIKNLTINLGIQTSFALASRGHWISKMPYNGAVLTFEDASELNIDSYDFGPKAGISYNINKHFSAEASYYYGVSNILSPTAPSEWKWKIQQITIGLRYKLFSTEPKSKT